jgi:hypothetical protein
MRLLTLEDDGEFGFIERLGDQIPEYAVLSHTWGQDEDEVTYRDMTNGTGKDKAGYRKIHFCAKQAAKDGLQYFWVDTCCIDKSSSLEVQEAINSMYRWFSDAVKCYAYLSDVSADTTTDDQDLSRTLRLAITKSRWFTRGWTLQELVAPHSVVFFSVEGTRLGDKQSMEDQLSEITGISVEVLRGRPLSEVTIEERMSWIEGRSTKREEDAAYCLLGIFDINMTPRYGEGRERAMARLERKITSLKNQSPSQTVYPASNITHAAIHRNNQQDVGNRVLEKHNGKYLFTIPSPNVSKDCAL